MSLKNIKKALEKSLLNDGEMEIGLYEFELEEGLEDLKQSMKNDKDDFIFSITEREGYTAMLLIEPNGNHYINEEARDKLKRYWKNAYEQNIKMIMPLFLSDLVNGRIPIQGVKIRERP